VVDVVSERDQPQDLEAENRKGGKIMQDSDARVVL
jgi:hypothetical protein